MTAYRVCCWFSRRAPWVTLAASACWLVASVADYFLVPAVAATFAAGVAFGAREVALAIRQQTLQAQAAVTVLRELLDRRP